MAILLDSTGLYDNDSLILRVCERIVYFGQRLDHTDVV